MEPHAVPSHLIRAHGVIAVPQGMMGPADSSRTHHALVLLRHKFRGPRLSTLCGGRAAGRSVTALLAPGEGDASNGMHAASTLKAYPLLEPQKSQ